MVPLGPKGTLEHKAYRESRVRKEKPELLVQSVPQVWMVQMVPLDPKGTKEIPESKESKVRLVQLEPKGYKV
jgi:hypothetical protein